MDRKRLVMNPGRPWPGDARLAESGVEVWAIVQHLRNVDWDVARTAAAYDVPVGAVAVEAAIAYYRAHQAMIDARLAEIAAHFER